MRILWFSNAPWSITGYGTQTNVVVPQLLGLGHKMAITSFWGLQGAPHRAVYPQGEVWVYPNGRDAYGNDVLVSDAQFFNADIVISMMDIWVLQTAVTEQVKWCPWLPVDHAPASPQVVKSLEPAFQPIAYSRFGVEMLKNEGIDALYVPLGVEIDKLYPEDREKSREWLGCPKDAFLIGIVAANKGYPSRKCFAQQLLAFAEFKKKHADAMLYIHTDFTGKVHGESIFKIIELCGIPENAILNPNQYQYGRGMFTVNDMRKVYSAMDVLSNASRGEGFGLPIIEAQACGVPVIVTNFSAMPELVGAGWLVEVNNDDKCFDMNSWQYLPKPSLILEAYEKAYTLSDEQRKVYAGKALVKAKEYEAETIAQKYWKPALEKIEQKLKETTAADNGHKVAVSSEVKQAVMD